MVLPVGAMASGRKNASAVLYRWALRNSHLHRGNLGASPTSTVLLFSVSSHSTVYQREQHHQQQQWYSTSPVLALADNGNNNNNASSSSPPRSLSRLRRPAGVMMRHLGPQQHQQQSQPERPGRFEFRRNALTVFPGDFRDHHDEDEEEDDDDNNNEPLATDHDEDTTGEAPDGDAEQDEMEDFFQRQDDARRERQERWLRSSQPPERFSEIDAQGRSHGKGGRKTAIATVWIQPGLGEICVNHQDFVEYFPRQSDREHVLDPLVVTETVGAFDVVAHVQGGGLTGQAGAMRLGLARALNAYNPDLYRPPLKRQGLLTRDARKVERKKVGLVKARKAPQWVRR